MERNKFYERDRTKELSEFKYKKLWATSVINGPECFETNEEILRIHAVGEDGEGLCHYITHKVIENSVLLTEIEIYKNRMIMEEMLLSGMNEKVFNGTRVLDLGTNNN